MVDCVRELDGQVAIVTGSAMNIGKAIVMELARAGAAVVVNARSSEDLCKQTVAEIEAEGGRAIYCLAEVSDRAAVDRMVAETVEKLGGLDIVVANAGVRTNTPFDEMSREIWDSVLDVSVNGTFFLAKAALPHMKARGAGNFIGVHGTAAHRGAPGRSHAMAARNAQSAMMRGMALDLAQYNIRCNTVVVGAYDTDRTSSSASARPSISHSNPIPLGRLGLPQDMADLVRFLVGPNAGYITGQTIHSNGGTHIPL